MNKKPFLLCSSVVDGRAFKPGAKSRTSFSPIIWVSLFLTLGFVQTGYPLPINIIATQYTTAVNMQRSIQPYDGSTTNFSRTQVSPAPISDAVYDTFTESLAAEANADLFAIYANTPTQSGIDPLFWNSSASATSDVWFSPLTSETATLNIQFSGGDHWGFSSSGTLSLFDVTSGNEVWNYGWGGFAEGTVAGVPVSELNPWGETTNLQLDTDFNAGDIYELALSTLTTAQNVDPMSPSISLQLSGLEAVPEPSTFALLGLGSLVLAMARRHR